MSTLAEEKSDRGHTLKPGDRLGRYSIISFLAAGGMGEIYVALDTRLDRRVAVKVLPGSYGGDPERLRRFEHEARAASRLSHPNLIATYDVGERGEMPYLVTELLEGKTLRRVMHERPLPQSQALELALQILRGLACAHERGIVHRDLKPSNVFVTTDGHVKILDFGLAKLIQPEWKEAGGEDETLSSVSTPGLILGSAGYMSPEQVRGAASGPASDIFSFGVLLYEMLTGRRAFKRESAVETMNAILTDMPEWGRDEVTPALSAILSRCLAKDPQDRFPAAREVVFVLEEVASGQSITASSTSQTMSQALAAIGTRHQVALAMLLLVAAIGLFGSFYSASSSTEAETLTDPPGSLSSVRATARRLTSHGRIEDAAFSADGTFMAYAAGGSNGRINLRLRHIPSGSDIELLEAPEGGMLRTAGFAPDGNHVYFRDYDAQSSLGLARLPLMGGTPQRLLEGNYSRLSFSPDGSQFAILAADRAAETSSLIVAASDGSNRRVIATLSGESQFIGAPAWIGQADRIVVATVVPDQTTSATEIDLATGEMRPFNLCPEIGGISDIQSLTSGGMIATSASRKDGQVWILTPDGSQCHPLTSDPSSYRLAASSGRHSALGVIGSQETYNLWELTLDGSEAPFRLTRGLNTRDGFDGIALLPDGRIVYTRNDSGIPGGNVDLWIHDRSTGSRRLTDSIEDESAPAISPDGRAVVFRRTAEDFSSTLWIMNLEGGEPRLLVSGQTPLGPSFSADGRFVYFIVAGEDRKLRLLRVAADGGDPVDVTPSAGCQRGLRVSPDERWIACGAGDQIVIASMQTGRTIRSEPWPPRASGLRWTPDSKTLLYARRWPDLTEFWAIPVNTGVQRKVGSFSSDEIWSYVLSPDGKKITGSRGSVFNDAFSLEIDQNRRELRQ
jgi:eukaryotic-like serine/threonine-protein kinase